METWEQIKTDIISTMSEFGLNLLYAILIVIAGHYIIKLFVFTLSKSRLIKKFDETVQTFIRSFVKFTLDIAVIVTACVVLGIPTTSFVTILASCGVAIGLAFQGSLSNLAGGLMLLVFKPFKRGDYIITDTDAGEVLAVNVFYTAIRTRDYRIITLPNGTLTNAKITNLSREDRRRVETTFGVAYGSDIDLVKNIVLETMEDYRYALEEPEPLVFIKETADNSINFTVRIWVETKNYWKALDGISEIVACALIKNDIKIPFPQMDVHFDKNDIH